MLFQMYIVTQNLAKASWNEQPNSPPSVQRHCEELCGELQRFPSTLVLEGESLVVVLPHLLLLDESTNIQQHIKG